jgi:hypothetical protein
MNPRTDDRLLPNSMAEEALNCDLSSGSLTGLPAPVVLKDLSATPGPVERAYRLPGPSGDVWLPLPSKFSSVVRSPLANDTTMRIYWTNPGDKHPWWSTYADTAAGHPPYNLGTNQPTTAPTVASVTGGDTSVPAITRSYVYTFVNSFGEESAPSLTSNLASGPSDATWHITGLPTAAPANPSDANYPPITKLRLYRTVTSQSAGAQYYTVVDLALPGSSTYDDTIPDTNIIVNNTLISTPWANPPDYLDGMTALPGGMLVGFTGNTIHFCEPNRPHTWPPSYDQSVHYGVVGITGWQQYLMVMTTGFPSVGSGNSPNNFILVQTQVPEPCIARGSIITDLLAIYYASQNGLIQLTGYSMQSQTLQMVDKNQWLTRFKAANLVACRHRAQYLAINGTGVGFLIDYSEQRIGFIDLNTFANVVCVWNDEYSGDCYMMADKIVYLWDSPNTKPLTYRWRSKHYYTPLPISLGAAQVTLDLDIYDLPPTDTIPPLDNGDPTLVLPTGINATFKLLAGPASQVMLTCNLAKTQEIFRLPKGFKAFDWQVEVVSRAKITSIQLASTLEELKGV